MTPFLEIRKTDLTVKHNTYEVNFPDHFHKYIELLYVCDGAQHMKIDGLDFTVNKGELAVIFPDITHSYFSAEKEFADELLIMCDPKLLGSLLPDIKNHIPDNPIVKSSDIDGETLFALSHLSPKSVFEVKFAYTLIILSNIINILILKTIKKTSCDLAYKIIEYVENNFAEDITRTSLAAMFNVNIYYISRMFKKYFNMNLRSYLGLVRSEHAASLIRMTDRPLTEIAFDSGFDSIRTFNRVFKDIYGISPSGFKNNIINYKNR